MGALTDRVLSGVKYSCGYAWTKKAAKQLKWKLKKDHVSRISTMDPEEAYEILTREYPRPVIEEKPVMRREKRTCWVSVIIAVYNDEDHIRENLDSVLREIEGICAEVIVVDDGSTDQTPEILDCCRDRYGIRVIHAENHGQYAALNLGLSEAGGEYLMFVDSDDYLREGMLRNLLRLVRKEKAEIACCNYINFSDYSSSRAKPLEEGVYTDFEKMVRIPGFYWGKLYHHSLFSKVNFPEYRCYGDTITHWVLFRRCSRIAVSNDYGYAYRENRVGVSYRLSRSSKAFNTLWVVEDLLKLRQRIGPPLLREDLDLYLRHMTVESFFRLRRMSEEEQEAFFVLAADLMERSGFPKPKESDEPALYRVFRNHDVGIWKLYCETH